jgi:hypothetical protein
VIKAACHIHSEWSYDGKWPLPMLAAEFGRRGFRVLLMTEHDRGFSDGRLLEYRKACAQASTKDVLMVPGIEYSDPDNIVHILVWGAVPFLGEALPTTDLLDKVGAAGGIAVFAHPSRKEAWKKFDPQWSSKLLGLEVWNRKTDGWSPSRTAFPLLEGTQLLPFVGMDFHDSNQMFPLAMQLDVALPLTEDSVLECLRAPHCRAAAFDRPVQEVVGGFSAVALGSAELVRRSATKVYRTWRKGAVSISSVFVGGVSVIAGW